MKKTEIQAMLVKDVIGAKLIFNDVGSRQDRVGTVCEIGTVSLTVRAEERGVKRKYRVMFGDVVKFKD